MIKINKTQILIITLCFVALFSCKFDKTKTSKQSFFEFVIDSSFYLPITIQEVELLINLTIEEGLKHFSNKPVLLGTDFNIISSFDKRLDNDEILKNLSQIKGNDTTIVYNENELSQFINDNNYLKGKSIKPFLSEKLQKYISDDYSDVIVVMGSPWIDRQNSIVYILYMFGYKFKNEKYYRGSHHLFSYKKNIDKDSWELFNIIQFNLK